MSTSEISPSAQSPLFTRLGAIMHVTVFASAPALDTVTPAPEGNRHSLPTHFNSGPQWQLQHHSLTSAEQITLNWQYQEWFSGGDGLSTYYFRDEDLLDDIARVFSRLAPVRESYGPELDYEYRVVSGPEKTPTAVLPSLLFYTSASGDAQFLALYNRFDADSANDRLPSVSIYEIVQLEPVDVETIRLRLLKAHQAAVRYRRELWG